MAQQPEELEQVPPVGHVRVVYLGPVAPHWEVQGVFGDRRIDDFRQRALARLQLLPPHDPQFRRNRERVPRRRAREPDPRLGPRLRGDSGHLIPGGSGRRRGSARARPALSGRLAVAPTVVLATPGWVPVTMNWTRSAIVTAWSAIRS